MAQCAGSKGAAPSANFRLLSHDSVCCAQAILHMSFEFVELLAAAYAFTVCLGSQIG